MQLFLDEQYKNGLFNLAFKKLYETVGYQKIGV